MDEKKFVDIGEFLVYDYINKRADGVEQPFVEFDDIFCVWLCKILQNNKGLFSTTIEGDMRYYEITFNGDKKEIYFDCYDKVENIVFNANKLKEIGCL